MQVEGSKNGTVKEQGVGEPVSQGSVPGLSGSPEGPWETSDLELSASMTGCFSPAMSTLCRSRE